MRFNRAFYHDMALWLYGLQSKMLYGWSGVDTPQTVTTTRATAVPTIVKNYFENTIVGSTVRYEVMKQYQLVIDVTGSEEGIYAFIY